MMHAPQMELDNLSLFKIQFLGPLAQFQFDYHDFLQFDYLFPFHYFVFILFRQLLPL